MTKEKMNNQIVDSITALLNATSKRIAKCKLQQKKKKEYKRF